MTIIYFATKVDRQKSVRFFMSMIIIILTLVAGLRHQTVGIDTQGYVNLISLLRNGYLLKLNNISEQGFIFLSYLLVRASGGYTLALLVFAFITNALIILRLYDYKDKISFAWSVFIYYMVFYFTTFNTIRQWLAMALVFWGSRYIGKSNIKFTLIVVLALLMHTTALFAFFMLPLYYFSIPSKNRRELMRKCTMLIFVFFASAAIYAIIVNQYSNYIKSSIYGNVSLLNIALLLFMCAIILFDNNGKLVVRIYGDGDSNDGAVLRYETLVFFIGIAVTLLVFFTRYADRVGQYFLLFEIVVLSYYIKKKKTRTITAVFVFLLCTYLRFSSFLSSGYGEIPYIPFWM